MEERYEGEEVGRRVEKSGGRNRLRVWRDGDTHPLVVPCAVSETARSPHCLSLPSVGV